MPKCADCEAADEGNQPFLPALENSPTSSTTPKAKAPTPRPPGPPGIFTPPGAASSPAVLPSRLIHVEDTLWAVQVNIDTIKERLAQLGAQLQELTTAVNNIQTRLEQNGDEGAEPTEGAQTAGPAAGEERPESAAAPEPHHSQGAPTPQGSQSSGTTDSTDPWFEVVDPNWPTNWPPTN